MGACEGYKIPSDISHRCHFHGSYPHYLFHCYDVKTTNNPSTKNPAILSTTEHISFNQTMQEILSGIIYSFAALFIILDPAAIRAYICRNDKRSGTIRNP